MSEYQFYTFPMFSFYMSDYYQLSFYSADHRMKHKDGSESKIGGYNHQTTDGLNYIMLNLYFIGKKMMDEMMSHAFECKDATVRIGDKEIGTANVKVNLIGDDEEAFQLFLAWFGICWWHEYLHMIGFMDEKQVHFMTRTDVHVIELD